MKLSGAEVEAVKRMRAEQEAREREELKRRLEWEQIQNDLDNKPWCERCKTPQRRPRNKDGAVGQCHRGHYIDMVEVTNRGRSGITTRSVKRAHLCDDCFSKFDLLKATKP